MVPDKKANVPYLIEAMIIYVIRSDPLNCKLVLLVFDYHIMIRKLFQISKDILHICK